MNISANLQPTNQQPAYHMDNPPNSKTTHLGDFFHQTGPTLKSR